MARETPAPQPHQYYSYQDLDFDLALSRSFWESEARHTVTIYRLDAARTLMDDVYGESLGEEKTFFPPVEVLCVPNLAELTNTFVVPGGAAKQLQALTLGLYLAELEEKECYPRKGDFVRYDNGQGPFFYELVLVDNILGANTHAGVPFYVGVAGVIKGNDAIPQGLLQWDE